jgi:predicted nucleic acid-binding protein
MISRVLVDSSVLIEFLKDRKTELLNRLVANDDIECFISETVVSEFLFHYLGIFSGRSPLAAKTATTIPQVLNVNKLFLLLESFSFLHTNDSLLQMVPEIMFKYNLLPNDAILVATYKIHAIDQLASFDSDFIEVCNAEGITLLHE